MMWWGFAEGAVGARKNGAREVLRTKGKPSADEEIPYK